MKILDTAFDNIVSNAWSGLKLLAGGILLILVIIQAIQEWVF